MDSKINAVQEISNNDVFNAQVLRAASAPQQPPYQRSRQHRLQPAVQEPSVDLASLRQNPPSPLLVGQVLVPLQDLGPSLELQPQSAHHLVYREHPIRRSANPLRWVGLVEVVSVRQRWWELVWVSLPSVKRRSLVEGLASKLEFQPLGRLPRQRLDRQGSGRLPLPPQQVCHILTN